MPNIAILLVKLSQTASLNTRHDKCYTQYREDLHPFETQKNQADQKEPSY